MLANPRQKKTAILILCVFAALMIAFIIIWSVKFRNSEKANNASGGADTSAADTETGQYTKPDILDRLPESDVQ